jgi:hypothetical protein
MSLPRQSGSQSTPRPVRASTLSRALSPFSLALSQNGLKAPKAWGVHSCVPAGVRRSASASAMRGG